MIQPNTVYPHVFGAEYAPLRSVAEASCSTADWQAADRAAVQLKSQLVNLAPHKRQYVENELAAHTNPANQEHLRDIGSMVELNNRVFGAVVVDHVTEIATGQQRLQTAHEIRLKDSYGERVLRAIDEGLIHWSAQFGLPNVYDSNINVLDYFATIKHKVGGSPAYVSVSDRQMFVRWSKNPDATSHYWDHEANHLLSATPGDPSIKPERDLGMGLKTFPLADTRGNIIHTWTDEAENESDTQIIADRNTLPYPGEVLLWTILKKSAHERRDKNIYELVGRARYGHGITEGMTKNSARLRVYDTLSQIGVQAEIGNLTDIQKGLKGVSNARWKIEEYFREKVEKVEPGMGSLDSGEIIELVAPHHKRIRDEIARKERLAA